MPQSNQVNNIITQKIAFLIAAVYGMTAVLLAAMGGHVLGIEKGSIHYVLFNNAVVYQLLHAILLLWLSSFPQVNFWVKSAIVSLIFGILFFCGGLYLLVLSGKTAFSWITPVGGSFLILAWLNLSISAFQKLFAKQDG